MNTTTDQLKQALNVLQQSKRPLTTNEMAEYGRLDQYEISNRIHQAERLGWVRRGQVRPCKVIQRPALEWIFIKEQ